MDARVEPRNEFATSKRGTIYFIREGDFCGNPVSDFVKIGLTGLDRKPGERVKDIKTGNPRELYVHHSVQVPFAQDIETAMRYEFLLELSNLEWHHFPKGSGRQLEEAIAYCEQLRDEFAAYEKIFIEAERLKEVLPSRDLIPPTPEAQFWSDSYVLHHHVAKRANEASSRKRQSAKLIVEQGGKAPEGTTVTTQERVLIDYEKFAEEHPELAGRYQKTRAAAPLYVLAVKRNTDIERVNLHPIFQRVTDEVVRYEAIMEREERDLSDDLYSDSYRQLIIIQQIAKHSEFRKTLAEWHLKVLCGDSVGIEGICKWDRVKKVVLDKERLGKEQAAILEQYRKEAKTVMVAKIERAAKGKRRT